MLLGGSGSVLDGNPLQSSISTPPSLGHIGSSSRFDPGIPINHEHEEVFEGQSPAPFTAPPSPAPTPRTRFAASHELESISQSRVMDENIASTSQNVAVAISQLNQSTQKKRHRQTEELELSQRLKELRSRHGLDHPATVDTAVRLAKILSYQGRYRSAELLLKQCMDCVTKTLGENNPKTLLISGELAECFIRQDNLSKAEKLLRTIFSKEYQVFHPSDQRFLSLKVLFANCIASLGDFTAARRVLHEVMAVGAAAPLADKGVLNECTIQLAHVLQRQGDLYKAEKLLLELVETDASDWVSVAHKLLTRRCLGETYVLQGKPRKAEQIFREVHKAQKESHGPEHDFTLYTEGCLASALNDLGKFVEGEELVRETIRKCTKVLGMKHNLVSVGGESLFYSHSLIPFSHCQGSLETRCIERLLIYSFARPWRAEPF
jgi:tetratricopeptide (TPR) repeat protein